MPKDRKAKAINPKAKTENVFVTPGPNPVLCKKGFERPELVRVLHKYILPGAVYKQQLVEAVKCEDIQNTAYLHTEEFLNAMQPRDPLEEMLIVQALWTHGRLAQLHRLATAPQTLDGGRTLHEAIDRAANTFRRQMLALAEYRNPRRGDSITLVKAEQANLAHQQIVNPGVEVKNMSNEQGAKHGDTGTVHRQPAQPQALEGPHTGRQGPLAGSSPAPQTVEAQHRPKNNRR